MERVQPESQNRRGLAGKFHGERVHDRVELLDRNDSIHEAEGCGLFGTNSAPGRHQFECNPARHGSEKWHGDHVRPEPNVDLGCPELRVICCDDEITGHGEPEPTRKREAAHPGDRRLSEGPEVSEEVGKDASAVVRGDRIVVPGDAPQVGPGAEGPVTCTGEHHNAYVAIRPRLTDGCTQALHHGERHRVPPFGAIDGQTSDSVVHFVFEFGHRGIVGIGSRDPPASVAAVWLLVLTLAAAAIVAIGTKGDLRRLADLKISGAWLLFLGLALQVGVSVVDIPKDQIETVGYGILMASYALILAFCFANISTRGFGLIAIGIALNALVIGLNQGMPTAAIGNDRVGHRIEKPIEQTVKHRPESEDDLVGFLGDKIVLPEPFDEVLSVGDIVMAVGIVELVYFGTRRPRRRRRGRSGQTRATGSPRRSSTRSRAPTTRPS